MSVTSNVYTFEEWMAVVDQDLKDQCGFSSMDLVDMPYRDWYNDGYEASEAAEDVLHQVGFPA